MSIIFVNQQATTGGDGTSWQSAYQTLNAALTNASDGDEIWVASGTYTPGTARSDSFDIDKGVSIYGGFAGSEANRSDRDFIQNLTILSGDLGAAGKSHHVVTTNSATQVRLDGIVVQDGDTTGDTNNSDGGGIYNQSTGKLLLENVIVQNNIASDDGGGIRNDGELIIVNSTVANNQANGTAPTTGGGGLLNTASAQATIIGSTFSNNSALNGGAIRNDNTLALINTTLSGNTGGGLLNTTDPNNPTASASSATIVNSTLTQNGGIGITTFGSVTLANSLIAGNTGSSDIAAFLFGTFTSNGNNLIGNRGTVNSFIASDLVGDSTQQIDPLLGTLQNNGGFTQTHLPTDVSPAVDSGNDALIEQDTLDLDGDNNTTEAIPFDQRDEGFARIFGTSVDIGAVESGNTIASTNPVTTTSTSANSDSRYIRLSLSAATSNQTDSDVVITIDEQGQLIGIDLNGLDLGGISLNGIDLGGIDFNALDLSGIDANIDLFTDLFGDAQTTLANLQLGSFDGLTLSRTEQIPDSLRTSLTNVLNVALAEASQSESLNQLLENSLIDSALIDSLIEQIQSRGSKISFQLNSNSADFPSLVLLAELTQDGPPLGTNLQGLNEPELIDLRTLSDTVTATFTVYREAAFDNQVGFFEIEDVTGQVLDAQGNLLGVGDDGYVLAAMQRRIETNLTTQNNQVSTYTAEITGGKLLSSFVISNGSIEALLDNDASNDPSVYFSHAGANSDGFDHIRLLGDNTFGYEDTAGGGDQDFNDLIIKASFAV
ncbi:MAG: DUF4114 domain-containing protein [Cyanobacteria bacterium P01_D01_bin.105]